MKAFLASLGLSLSLLAGSATAAPVSLTFSNSTIQSNGNDAGTFADIFAFTLSVPTTLSGSITTNSLSVFGPFVDITQAYLSLVGGSTQVNLVETQSPDWDVGAGVEIWTLLSQPLAAGDWELHVIGLGFNDKSPDGYVATFSGTPVEPLPEPASLALVVLAVSAAGLVRRRRRGS